MRFIDEIKPDNPVYREMEPIKEITLKESLKIGSDFDIEFRENALKKDFKYKYRKKPRYWFVVVTAKKMPYILHTQKGKVRDMTSQSCMDWLDDIGYNKPAIFRRELEATNPEDPLTVPTYSQLHVTQANGAAEKLARQGTTYKEPPSQEELEADRKAEEEARANDNWPSEFPAEMDGPIDE